MKRVYSSLNLAEVSILKGFLEGCGIPCAVRNDILCGLAGEVPFADCSPELWVRNDEDLPRAADLVREFHASPATPWKDWRCAACGEDNEGQFARCWNCGAGLV